MIRLKHPQTNVVKECSTGYSWTTFFFGLFVLAPLVPLVRGDLKWATILFLLTLLVGCATLGLGCFLVGPIFAAFYNKIFITSMVEKGYIGKDTLDNDWLVSNKIIFKG